ncbi:MAG: dTDP-4-dehydrorhamnose 3,5-epimerase [Muribaculaceae bacterium]|nr:dTDP-4-dehydrorhamnose 3,5-epimerase [Muribaculaceae bacterium]
MEFIETDIQGVYILKPEIFRDERGYFMETYRHSEFTTRIGAIDFVQDNESSSSYGVIRGLHFQKMPHSQSKLVRCISGIVQDVAVDLRASSPTYGQHISVILRADEGTQLFIPRGFAHGFAVLSEMATFQYKCDAYYHPEAEGGINPFDPTIGINWMIKPENAILSDKDRNRPNLDNSSFYFKGNLYDRI